MRSLYIIILFNIIFLDISLGQKDTLKNAEMEEVVISANKVPERKAEIAQQISLIKKEWINSIAPLNVADALQASGEVFVQKSQQGGGSPVLRGFEASRVLLVVDGVRLNNFIYRAGHLQNAITIDPNLLDRIEILSGPGSTVYGSDALGGVLNFRTKAPKFSNSELTVVSGSVMSGFHTANNGANLNASINIGKQRFASLTGITLTHFGDLKMGAAKNPFNDDGYFGSRPTYVDRVDGKDVLVQNSDPLVQKYSGYDQIDIIQKFTYLASSKVTHSLNIQYSNSTDLPRYDRLTDPKGSGLKSAEWYYGPQRRLMTIYRANVVSSGFFEIMDFTASYQSIQESRHNRNFGSDNLAHRVEDVQVAGLQFSALHKVGKNELRVGSDVYWNGLKSTANQENIVSKVSTPLDTRYPDGDNSQINVGAYFTHTYRINDHFILNDGLRLGVNSLKSTFATKTFFPFPFDEVKQNNFVYSGNVGAVYMSNGFRAVYSASLGFRTPNVDDLSKVFESSAGTLIIPNPNLKPETTVNQEINLGYFDKSWTFENVFYYTMLNNFISLSPSTFNGQSSITYEGEQSTIYTSTNKAKGYVYGVNSSLKKKLNGNWLVYGGVGYTYGRTKEEGVISPMDHISPLLLRSGVEYTQSKFDGAFYLLYNGKKDISDYSPSGEDNGQYAPSTGMPAWMTLNVKMGYKLTSNLKVQAGVENIADVQYRYFASGINAPGRNIWASARLNF